ncbi:MAG: hypothetical protein IT495_09470 [Gammaproteobacteria bacterium]|nr:hypothetical protein [Gammaproteobacteria bacterium]
MKQLGSGGTGFEKYGNRPRRTQFLLEMDRLMSWAKLCAMLNPHCAKTGPVSGSRTVPLERMPRVYCMQHWFCVSDPAVE